ncbi:MAG: TspO/MBR family protein [Methanobacteriaceae archaeon]
MESFKKEDIYKIVISLVIVFVVGMIGSFATASQIPTWYAALAKPAWTPAGWVFPIVWTSLYILMSMALFLVWRNGIKNKEVKTAMALFGVQLALNAIWSIVFFGLHSITGGLGTIILLWIFILINIVTFYKISKWAGVLLIPYTVWVTIATYLNYSVYLLN